MTDAAKKRADYDIWRPVFFEMLSAVAASDSNMMPALVVQRAREIADAGLDLAHEVMPKEQETKP